MKKIIIGILLFFTLFWISQTYSETIYYQNDTQNNYIYQKDSWDTSNWNLYKAVSVYELAQCWDYIYYRTTSSEVYREKLDHTDNILVEQWVYSFDISWDCTKFVYSSYNWYAYVKDPSLWNSVQWDLAIWIWILYVAISYDWNNYLYNTPTDLKLKIKAFWSLPSQEWTYINNQNSYTPYFTPDWQNIIYWTATSLYMKSASDLTNNNWTQITNIYWLYPIVTSDWQNIIYWWYISSYKLYSRPYDYTLNNWTQITTDNAKTPVVWYSPYQLDPNAVEYCYVKPIKESVLNVNTSVFRSTTIDKVVYEFSNNSELDLRLILDDWLDDFTEANILSELWIRWFDTVLTTFDRDIQFELNVIDWTYEIFLWTQTNITWVESDLWLIYNTDFTIWKITVPWNINKFQLDWNFLLSPYSTQLIIFKNTNNGTQYCFTTSDSWIKSQMDELIKQEAEWVISTDDMIYDIEQIVVNNQIVPTDEWQVTYTSNNIVPTIDWVWVFDFLFNPIKQTLDSTAFKFISDLLLLNDLPSSIDNSVTFNLAKPVINSNWTFWIATFPVELEFISDKFGISTIERNSTVQNFMSFFLALFYIMSKVVFIFILLAPIFFILWIFKQFSAIFDLSKNTTWNLVSIPLYLTYLTAFFVTIWTFWVLIWSFYDFIMIVYSYLNYIFIWISWSLWSYEFFRNVVLAFYVWLGSTLTAFILYRAFSKFAKVN